MSDKTKQIENNKLEIPVVTYLFLLKMETIFCK